MNAKTSKKITTENAAMNQKPTVEEIIKCECSPKHAYELMSQNMELKMWCCDWADDAVRQRQFVGYKRGRCLPWQTTDGENLHAALERDIITYREKQLQSTIQGHNPANAPIDSLPAPNGRFFDADEIYQDAPLRGTDKVWYWNGDHWSVDNEHELGICYPGVTYYTTMSRKETDAERRKQLIENCGFKVGDEVKSSSNATYTINGLLAWLPTDPMPIERSDLVNEKARDKKPFVYMRNCEVSTPVSKLTHAKPELIPLTPADIAKRSDMRVRKKDWQQGEFAVIACVRDDQCFVAQSGIVSLSELLEKWEWLDGSPCGKQPESEVGK